MDNIILAFNVVFPLIFMLSIGYGLRRLKVTDEPSLNVMNKLVFRVFLPILLFLNIYSLKPEEALNIENTGLLCFTALSVIGITLLMHLLFPIFIKEKKKCCVMIQGIFRSNLVLFGIPIAISIYGEKHIGKVSLLAAFIVPLFNILAVLVLEYYRGNKAEYKKILLSILQNPLIVASILAFLLLMLHIPLPELLLTSLSNMSKVATPLAFVVLGGTFQFTKLASNMKHLFTVVAGKLILFPAIVFTLAILVGFRREALIALLGAVATPTAVSSFSMAMEMDADSELAGQIVVFTSVFSILTIFLWVLFLRSCGFI